jgi:hypothetical protein
MLRSKTMAGALLAAAALACSSTALAADPEEVAHWRVGITGGSLGIGPELGYRFGSHLGIRANGGFFGYDKSDEEDDFDYDATLKLNSVGAMVDIFPFGGSLRLSVGARSSRNEVTADLVPIGTVEINDQTYTAAEFGTGSGTVKWKKFAPSATIGWAGDFSKGLHLGLELGVMMQGSSKIDFTVTGQAANDPQFMADLQQEIDDAEDDAKDYKLWPIVALTLSYSF